MGKSNVKKLVGIAVAISMMFIMNINLLAAGSPSADFKQGTRAVDPEGNVVEVVVSELPATTAPLTDTDIQAVIPGGTAVVTCEVTAQGWDFSKGPLTIVFPVPGVTPGTKAAVLHYNGSDWENVTGVVGNGSITGVFESLSPVAIVVDKSTMSNVGGGTGTSPQTGEPLYVLYAGGVVLIALLGVYGLNRKSILRK